ncbi:hypothetical protein HOLleu_17092 [Holothuria leucospilota]|uniref:Uncharacterized protein n=1 Tax=Holothuria leucospilota TaxID=206669 RepID=A0A9Q1HAX6_HOLLE|nr:hypothetical protein HOLleu_17092 [Holothuria leucospilota]
MRSSKRKRNEDSGGPSNKKVSGKTLICLFQPGQTIGTITREMQFVRNLKAWKAILQTERPN